MKAERYFLDTNIVLYAVDADERKADIADGLICNGCCLSAQIFNESVEVMRRKLKAPWERVRSFLEYLESNATRVEAITLETHERALDIAEATNIRIYDALLIAAAEQAKCTVLYTEDLNHGQRVGGVTICNPFIVE
jgi:predicted nucleic acid-binding protein